MTLTEAQAIIAAPVASANKRAAAQAIIIADATETAYMNCDYGPRNWMAAIKYLLSIGCTPLECEVILRSKHMRWASDVANGKITTKTLQNYAEGKTWKYDLKHEAQMLILTDGTSYCSLA